MSKDEVLKDLQEMIDIGYLKDAFIHQGKREIVFNQHISSINGQISEDEQIVVSTRIVKCPGCGANNVVSRGSVSKCEYCETPIQAH